MTHDWLLMRFQWQLVALGLVVQAGCRAGVARDTAQDTELQDLAPTASVPVVTEATVIAFWLASADTLAPAMRQELRDQFRRLNQAVARYLQDTDVGMIATLNDTLIIQLEGGPRRTVILSGLDYPYGYVLVEPGYAEEFHTGIDVLDDLEAAIDDYFGLEDDEKRPQRRIAAGVDRQGDPLHPGPRTMRPGLAPVCAPSFTTAVPFTKTCLIPTESWWGRSKVARSATVAGSKTTISA
jgi:hypothetical protein